MLVFSHHQCSQTIAVNAAEGISCLLKLGRVCLHCRTAGLCFIMVYDCISSVLLVGVLDA